jgi:hypothetical protein
MGDRVDVGTLCRRDSAVTLLLSPRRRAYFHEYKDGSESIKS